MAEIFDLATKISTPLALGGLLAAILFFILRQLLAKDIFPQLARVSSAKIITTIINRLFVLALIAMLLGFAGFVVPIFTSPAQLVEEEASVGERESQAAIGLGINFSTLAFLELQGITDPDLDARISGQLTLLGVPIKYPQEEMNYGGIRLLQEQLRAQLVRKDESLYSWYRYGFLFNGKVPVLEMMKTAIDSGDVESLETLTASVVSEQSTLSNIEESLGFPKSLRERADAIYEQLAGIDEDVSKVELLTIQESIVAYLDDLSYWAGKEHR